jgi:tetratricopeptide (TPR) repeat protein
VDNLAVVHHQPGNIYYDAGDLDRALPYYREAIRYEEMQGVTVQPALSLRAISAKQSPTLPTADRNAEIASSQKTLLAMTPERLPKNLHSLGRQADEDIVGIRFLCAIERKFILR